MKRFIDLRKQGTGFRFAWWDTVVDRFLVYGDNEAWDTFQEFAEDYDGHDLDRYLKLTPKWALSELTADDAEDL